MRIHRVPAPDLPLQTPDPPARELHTAADSARAESALIHRPDLNAGFRADRARARNRRFRTVPGYPGDRSDVTITGSATSSFRYRSIAIGSRAVLAARQ